MEGSVAGELVRLLTEADYDRWDRFVDQNDSATFFHKAGWKTVIENSFNHRTYYIYVERRGEIQGILPLVHLKSWLFGNGLVSTSFCVSGGPIANDDGVRARLDEYARNLSAELDVDYLEYRNSERLYPDRPAVSDLYYVFRKKLAESPDENLNGVPRKQRASIRQSLKNGLDATIEDDAKGVFSAYAESVRNLGTPVFPEKYFANLKSVFGRDCELLVIRKDGRIISGVLSFYFKDQVLPYYGGGTYDARRFGANDFMYWDLMKRAGQSGFKIFDFGRSKAGTGAYNFKKNWGFEPTPLIHEYLLRKRKHPPSTNPLNPKYRLMIALWKKLPLPVANMLGPFIVRGIG